MILRAHHYCIVTLKKTPSSQRHLNRSDSLVHDPASWVLVERIGTNLEMGSNAVRAVEGKWC